MKISSHPWGRSILSRNDFWRGSEGGAGPLQSRRHRGNHRLYEEVPMDHQTADRGLAAANLVYGK